MLLRPRFCGHLSDPESDCGDSDYGEIVPCGLLIAGCNAAELLELAEAAFDEVSLGIEVLVERILLRARRIVWDDGQRALVGDGEPEWSAS